MRHFCDWMDAAVCAAPGEWHLSVREFVHDNGAAARQIGVVQSRAQLVSRPVRGLSEEMMGIVEGPPARN